MNVRSLISRFEVDQKAASEHVPVKLYIQPQPNIREIIPRSGSGKRKSSTSETIRFLDGKEKKRVAKGLGIIGVLQSGHNITEHVAESWVEKEHPTSQVQPHKADTRSKTSTDPRVQQCEDDAEGLSANGIPRVDECLTMRKRHSEISTEWKLVGDLHFSYLNRPQSDDLDELDFASAIRKMNGSFQLEVLKGNTELQIAYTLQRSTLMVGATSAKSLDPQPTTTVPIDRKEFSRKEVMSMASEGEMEKEGSGQTEQKMRVGKNEQNTEEEGKGSSRDSDVKGASTPAIHETLRGALNNDHHGKETVSSSSTASSHYSNSIVASKNSQISSVKNILGTPTQFSSLQSSPNRIGFGSKSAGLRSVAESSEDSCYSTVLIQDYLEDEDEPEIAASNTISAPHQGAPVHDVEAPSTPVSDSPSLPDKQQSIFAAPRLNRGCDTLLHTQQRDHQEDNVRGSFSQSSEPTIYSNGLPVSTTGPPRPESSPPMLRHRQPNQNVITNIEETIQSMGGHETQPLAHPLPELTFAISRSKIWWVFPKFKKRKLSKAKTKSKSHIIDKISTPTNVRDLAFEDFHNLTGTQTEHPVVKFIERFEPARLLPVMINVGVQTEPLKVSAAFRMARKAINDARSLHLDAKKSISRLGFDCIGDLDEVLTKPDPFCYRRQSNNVEAFERYIDGVFRLKAA